MVAQCYNDIGWKLKGSPYNDLGDLLYHMWCAPMIYLRRRFSFSTKIMKNDATILNKSIQTWTTKTNQNKLSTNDISKTTQTKTDHGLLPITRTRTSNDQQLISRISRHGLLTKVGNACTSFSYFTYSESVFCSYHQTLMSHFSPQCGARLWDSSERMTWLMENFEKTWAQKWCYDTLIEVLHEFVKKIWNGFSFLFLKTERDAKEQAA